MNFVDHRIQDFRFGIRQLLKHRGFACTALTVLTLGLATSISIFAFVDAAMIKPLPYDDPSRLVTVFGAAPDSAAGQTRGVVSYLDFVDWRARNRAFASIAAYDVREGFTLITGSGPQSVPGLRVTSGFFRTLGVSPLLGREFLASEEGPSAPPTVMLSYSAWQTRFGGSPGVLGRTVTLQSPWLSSPEPHVVIGVLPREFQFPMASHAEFWATIRRPQACWNVRSCSSLQTVARLAAGLSQDAASTNMTAVIEQLRSEYPDDHRNPEIAKLVGLREVILGSVRSILLMLLSGAGLLLVIAYVNVMSLLLARTDSRVREISIRHALGASAVRLIMQFAGEAFVLAVTGAVFGLVLARWGIQFLASLLSADMISRMPYLGNVGLSLRVVAFACVVSLIGALAFAVTPLARMAALQSSVGLNEGSRGSASTHWRRLGAHLIVAELAIAVLLVVSAGLLGKSLYRLLHVDAGFNVQGLASVSVTPVSVRPGDNGPNREHPNVLAQRVAERVAALPGVESVGYADLLPLAAGLAPASSFWVLGRDETHQQLKEYGPVRRVSAGYFHTLQATLLRGRFFTDAEVSSARPVMIINETAARQYFRGDDPLGRLIAFGGPASPAREVVGVIADIKDSTPETPAHPSAYVPFAEIQFGLVIRTTRPEPALAQAVVAAIKQIRPDALVSGMSPMAGRMNRLPSVSLHRSTAWLVAGFAVTALVLSIAGLYGVVAYSVGQRTREIGVRMALGARRGSVYRLVMGEALRLVGIGAVLGLVLAVTVARLMRHLLFSVQAWDPPTLLAGALVLGISALAASYVPARRAASVDPIEVLRSE